MNARKPLDREQRFVFGDRTPEPAVSPQTPTNSTNIPQSATDESNKPSYLGKPRTPWSDLEPPEKEATVRLNVDISLTLNDKLAVKARQLRKPKTELVRHLLEWALDESNE